MTSVRGNEKKVDDLLNNGLSKRSSQKGEKEIEEPKKDNCEKNLIQKAQEKIQEGEETELDQGST